MDGISGLLKNENRGQLILIILFAVYLILGFKTPEPIASLVDTIGGKIVLFIMVVFLFTHTNPILGILGLIVAYDLMRRSSAVTGIDALKKYGPSEEKKQSQFTAFNQFPYTLEQEVVAKMAPVIKHGTSINNASYKPTIENNYDASPI